MRKRLAALVLGLSLLLTACGTAVLCDAAARPRTACAWHSHAAMRRSRSSTRSFASACSLMANQCV